VSERQLNKQAAEIFRECAGILQHQAANPFRVNAYVRAANVLDSLQDDVREILDREGTDGLVKLPGIGEGLAAAIDEIARTGRLSQLDRLRGEASPETLFQTLPGVGRKLAEDIHDPLQEAGGRWRVAENRAQTLQSRGQGMAADPARRARGLAFHGVVLEHRAGTRPRQDG